MIFWARTKNGWAVNLDGTDAALVFALPRIELRANPRGWSCVCHLADRTSLLVPIRRAVASPEAMRLAIEGSLPAVGPDLQAALRALLAAPADDRGNGGPAPR